MESESNYIFEGERNARPAPGAREVATVNTVLSLDASGPNLTPAQWPLSSSFSRLGELQRIKPNWDGEGSEPPSAWATALARRLLLEADQMFATAAGENIRPFAVAPMSGAGVHLEWRSPSADLEVEITNNRQLGYLFTDKSGQSERFEEADDVSVETILERLEQVLLGDS